MQRRITKLITAIRNDSSLFLMALPCFALLFVFSYIPMGGVILAFKN
jgi:putative aldouronate transport system permease protein